MSKTGSSIAVATLTLISTVGFFGWAAFVLAIVNGVFVHQFLTMKGE